MSLPYSFVAYIDESGDEGFKFPAHFGKGEMGSSEWFVLSAVVVRRDRDTELVRMVRDTTKNGLKKRPAYIVHFRKLNHSQRVLWMDRIAKSVCVAINILVHKPSLIDSFNVGSRLYLYSTRLLLERISWYCRDQCPTGEKGTVRLVFANRANLSYEELRDYIDLLRRDSKVQIHWPVIETELVQPRQPVDAICLQVSDGVAGAFAAALEYSHYGFTEDRFVEMLKPVIYRRGKYQGYGLKFFPKTPPELEGCATRLQWITKLYPA